MVFGNLTLTADSGVDIIFRVVDNRAHVVNPRSDWLFQIGSSKKSAVHNMIEPRNRDDGSILLIVYGVKRLNVTFLGHFS